MARQVYYDPFGARTEGFREGMQDEMGLQKNIRDARSMDWDYRNMKPLELQEAQRIAAFNQYADPYARRALGTNEQMGLTNLFGAQLPLYGYAGDITGNYNPAVGLSQRFLGVPQTTATPEQLQSARERFNRDYIYQVGEANRNYGLRQDELANQVARQNWEMQTHGQITPRDLVYSPMFTASGGAAGTTANNPNDWSPYGATQPQTQGQGPMAPAYQFPGLNIPGFDPNNPSINPGNQQVMGVYPAPGVPPTMQVPQNPQFNPTGYTQGPYGPVGNPYPPGMYPAIGPSAVNMYPTYADGTPIAYGTPEWQQYMQQFGGITQPQGETQPQPQPQQANVDWAF